VIKSFSLNTCTQPGTPLINDFVDRALWNRWRNGDTSITSLWDIARWSKFAESSARKYNCDL